MSGEGIYAKNADSSCCWSRCAGSRRLRQQEAQDRPRRPRASASNAAPTPTAPDAANAARRRWTTTRPGRRRAAGQAHRLLRFRQQRDQGREAPTSSPPCEVSRRPLRRPKVRLEGHTDERGSREYNIGLGERRAQAVRRALLLQGATDAQLSTVSYGEERPAVAGHDEAAWAKNRRVEIVYLAAPTGAAKPAHGASLMPAVVARASGAGAPGRLRHAHRRKMIPCRCKLNDLDGARGAHRARA